MGKLKNKLNIKPKGLNNEKDSKNQMKISSFFKTKQPNSSDSSFAITDPTKNVSPKPLDSDLSSSDIEIIEPTPENKGIYSMFSSIAGQSNFLSDSLDDIIPCTPQILINKNKSLLRPKQSNLSRLSNNLSLNRKKKSCTEVSTNQLLVSSLLLSNVSRKRPAESKTGISPNPKKNVENGNIKVLSTPDKEASKVNLLSRLNDCPPISDNSNVSEDSFSLLQPGPKSPSTEEDIEMNLLIKKLVNKDDKVIPLTSITETPCSTTLKFKNSIEESFSSNAEDFDANTRHSTAFILDDDSLDELLSEDFDSFSPFKNKTSSHQNMTNFERSSVSVDRPFIENGNFGRYSVVAIDRNDDQRNLLLHLKCCSTKNERKCYLSGFWYESLVKEDDIVHIISHDTYNGDYYISDQKGIIVINPDFLISGTAIVGGVFCQRKAVLNERFKGFNPGNKIMLIGTLVHQLFQEAVEMKSITLESLQAKVKELLYRPNVLKELYGLEMTECEMEQEMEKFTSSIVNWINNYICKENSAVVRNGKDSKIKKWTGKIESIEDIEENLWSPKFGIKGKIDLTVKTTGAYKRVLPLELKTGKSSFSAEHQGQVTLYSMMSSDRREDPQAGLLLYLRDGSMSEVPAGEKEKKGLIQMRNELVSFLKANPGRKEDPELPPLPEPLSNERTCSRCPHAVSCCAFQKVSDSVPEPPHAMASLVPQTLDHLKENHLEYFRRWCLLLHLEIAATKNRALSDLWCVAPKQRESSGDCLQDLVLDAETPVQNPGHNQFLHIFHRNPSNAESNLPLIFNVSESIVASSEKELALTVGVVVSLERTRISVILDRNLKLKPLWRRRVFRLDRCEYQNTMSAFFTNLAHLISQSPRTEKLRKLIIDKEPPSFSAGVDRSVLGEISSAVKNLNKNQQRAVLRAMLANDYCLLKGFPGTGKTSTIVGLVKLLHSLGKSVIITSYTHSAVDNILMKLKNCDVPCLRLGRISRIHPDVVQFSEEKLTKNIKNLSELEEFYNSHKIVATTCLGMNHVVFSRKTFDYCIMDEAAQVLQAASLAPLFFSERFILVGDSLQLPPIVKSQTAKSLGMMESLFEYLDNAQGSISLVQQYRMNEPIMAIANHLIYDGQLQCATEEQKTATLNLERPISCPSWVSRCISSDIDDSVLFVDTNGEAPEVKNSSKQPTNPREAAIICCITSHFKKCGLSLDEIGVITPYRAQVKLLKEKLNGAVEVNTVDQFQGRDKRVIIYSCVRSGLAPEDIKKGEILQDLRRLNVAITRAKHKLLILGEVTSLKLFDPFQKIFQVLRQNQIYKIQNQVDWDLLTNETYD